MSMTGDEFVSQIDKLQKEHQLTDDQVCSALLGIVIALCRERGHDPLSMMYWAVEAAAITGN